MSQQANLPVPRPLEPPNQSLVKSQDVSCVCLHSHVSCSLASFTVGWRKIAGTSCRNVSHLNSICYYDKSNIEKSFKINTVQISSKNSLAVTVVWYLLVLRSWCFCNLHPGECHSMSLVHHSSFIDIIYTWYIHIIYIISY